MCQSLSRQASHNPYQYSDGGQKSKQGRHKYVCDWGCIFPAPFIFLLYPPGEILTQGRESLDDHSFSPLTSEYDFFLIMLVDGSVFDPLADENLGSMVIGLAISLVLFGVVIIQSYTYYQRFGDDRWSLKALVSLFYYSSTVQPLMLLTGYHRSVSNPYLLFKIVLDIEGNI
jgi:hypothetical protein